MQKIQKQICITGLGHIGLPTACVLANSGYSVLGVDLDDKVIDRILSKESINPEPNLQNLLTNCIRNGDIRVSNKAAPADIHIISVPTPLNQKKQPDISQVNAAIEAINSFLREDDLVLIESTCPIGTTAKIAKRLQSIFPSIHVAYCPERVLPGNILYELIHNDRVVGGINGASASKAANFYRSFIKGEILITDDKTAEAVKLAENAYRDVNIAYANELSMILDYNNLDVLKVIKLANRHPRVQILQPGPGVGGHCIAIDPWFLVSAAPNIATLIPKAREINTQKTAWVIQKIINTINKNKISKIACLGLTYKPNVSDIRESPALIIVEALEKEFNILRVDPHIQNTEALYDAIAQSDMVVVLVAHNEFLNISADLFDEKILLDFAGVF